MEIFTSLFKGKVKNSFIVQISKKIFEPFSYCFNNRVPYFMDKIERYSHNKFQTVLKSYSSKFIPK